MEQVLHFLELDVGLRCFEGHWQCEECLVEAAAGLRVVKPLPFTAQSQHADISTSHSSDPEIYLSPFSN